MLVDSTQCHLWTDALHVRQLAHDTPNRWDRGTYVRLCVVLAWTALEIACQDALNAPEIGYQFKKNWDRAVAGQGLTPLDWSQGLWQDVRRLQELRKVRKAYAHKFATLDEMFPDGKVADDAIAVVRAAIEGIFVHAGLKTPAWVDFHLARGWDSRSGLSDSSTATLITGGTSLDDPTAVRIFFVVNGVEQLSSVHPQGTDYRNEVDRLVAAVNVPISAVRVYEGNTLVLDKVVNMRGNH